MNNAEKLGGMCPIQPLTTPDLLKYIDEELSYPSPPMRSDMNEPLSIEGLMEGFQAIDHNTMVSPNTVCFGLDATSCDGQMRLHQQQHQQQSLTYAQPYQYNDNGYSSSSSFPASPESMILPYEQMNISNFSMPAADICAASPADSHFSTDSGASFYNLDQPIKTENQDFPQVIDELNQGPVGIGHQVSQVPVMAQQQQQQQQQQQPMYNQTQYVAQNTQYVSMDQGGYQYQDATFMPTTVPTTVSNMINQIVYQVPDQMVMTQQLQQQPQQVVTAVAPMSVKHVIQPISSGVVAVGRKRSPNGAFASTSGESSSSASHSNPSGAKKQRLTKRQKQQMMDKQVEEYTQKNKELRSQIELMERKVQLCTGFLQKYVSPIVQNRQNTSSFVQVVDAVNRPQ